MVKKKMFGGFYGAGFPKSQIKMEMTQFYSRAGNLSVYRKERHSPICCVRRGQGSVGSKFEALHGLSKNSANVIGLYGTTRASLGQLAGTRTKSNVERSSQSYPVRLTLTIKPLKGTEMFPKPGGNCKK